MERRAERATALGGAQVRAISVASIRGKLDHPGAAASGDRPEDAKPFQTDEAWKPFFPPAFAIWRCDPSQTGVAVSSFVPSLARFNETC